MGLKDFKEEGNKRYISNDIFSFDNGTFKFKYRLLLTAHTYQDDTVYGNKTRYQVYLIVEDECIHPNHKEFFFKEVEHGFLLKKVEKKGDFNEEQAEKILDSALKIKVENKIKIKGYEKIKGLLFGTPFFV